MKIYPIKFNKHLIFQEIKIRKEPRMKTFAFENPYQKQTYLYIDEQGMEIR